MRRVILALTAVLVIVFLIAPIAQMGAVEANPYNYPSIGIESPKVRIYQTTTIPVVIQINTPLQYPKIIEMSYSLDGNPQRALSISNSLSSSYLGTGILVNLTNGTHSLEIYALDAQGKIMSPPPRTFLVNTTFRYPTLLLSPLNITYSKNEVPLNYTINEQANCGVYYSLDNSHFRQIAGNITLPVLSEGQHTITIRATTGNSPYSEQINSLYSEQIAYFTIKTTKSEQPLATSNLTIALVIATIAIIIGASLAVLAYKRRKLEQP